MYTVLYLCRHVLLYMQRTRRRCMPTALYVRVFVSLEGCVRCRLLLFLGGWAVLYAALLCRQCQGGSSGVVGVMVVSSIAHYAR